jgi:hypothetical protein
MVSNHDIARSHCIKPYKLFQNNYTFKMVTTVCRFVLHDTERKMRSLFGVKAQLVPISQTKSFDH